MNNKLLILILLLNALALHAQQIITTAGNYTSGTTGSLSWTIGEAVIETYTGTHMILTQGFQQPKLTITAIKDLPGNSLEISVYPNPTADFISLKVTTESVKNLKFMLYDLYGKLLLEQNLMNSETKIPFNNLASGTYLLKLFKNNQEMQVFKIVKQ